MAAAARQTMKTGTKMAKPIISTDLKQAHTRVLGLYRGFYRYIPYILKYQDIPKNAEDCRVVLRGYFYRNAHIKDVRVIDVLIIKGYIELREITHQWQQKAYIMNHWHPSIEPKPTDFLGKFLTGHD